MPEPTVEQLMNMDKVPVRKPSALVPIIAFFLLPPWGIYLLWKEKSFHVLFAILSAVFGVLNLLTCLSTYAFISSSLGAIFSQLQINTGSINTLPLFIGILLSAAQTAISYYLLQKSKTRGYLLSSELITLTVLVLAIDIVIIPILIGIVALNSALPLFQQYTNPYKDFPVN